MSSSSQGTTLGRRVINSILYRTGLQRPAARARHAVSPRWARVAAGPLAGGQLFLDPGAPAYWEREMLAGTFDPFIYETLAAWGRAQGGVFWDVGAHIGYHSLCFAALAGPSGRVVSFEPNPFNAARLRQHLDKNPELAARVTLETCALSDSDGEASFEFSPEIDDGTSSGSHLSAATAPGEAWEYEHFKRTDVRVARADTLLAEGRLPAPSVMKIDVEGAEQMVLEGARGLLSDVRPLLFVEVHNISQMFHVQNILFRAGYAMDILDAEHSSASRCFTVARPA
jgi:FkbM family methyltransferase